MRSNTKKKAATEQNLLTFGHSLPLHIQQALTFSAYYVASYLNDHPTQYAENGGHDNAGNSSESEIADMSPLMAAGRLEWLLRETRPSLSGRVSERDIVALLDCYQGQIFSPDEFDFIASDLGDQLGLQSLIYGSERVGQFGEKLAEFSAAQRLALADALEQAWHRGMIQEGQSPKDFFATLGIDLT